MAQFLWICQATKVFHFQLPFSDGGESGGGGDADADADCNNLFCIS